MQIREIPHGRWDQFFDDFNHLHQGEHVNVETINGAELGVTSHLCDLRLVGIVEADPQAGAAQWIEVITGESPDTGATHRIPSPSHVVLAEEENGRAVALQIESDHGQVTMVRFEPPREAMRAGFKVS